MAVSTLNIYNSYNCDGETVEFDYTFRLLNEEHLTVILRTVADGTETELTLNSHFEVEENDNGVGGTITLIGDYAEGGAYGIPGSAYELWIIRTTPITQATDWVAGQAMNAETLEKAHDKGIMVSQERNEELDRTPKFKRTSGQSLEIDDPVATKVLRGDGAWVDGAEIHEATYDHSVLHTQNTDTKLGVGGAFEVGVQAVHDAASKRHTQNSDTILTTNGTTALINAGILKSTMELEDGLENVTAAGFIVERTVGEDVSFGVICYPKSDGKYWKARGNAATTMPAVVMALENISANNAGKLLVLGLVRDDNWNWTLGAILYVSTTNAGAMTHTQPSGSGQQIQAVGIALAANLVLFRPDFTYIEHK